jgi:hypothetical protein
VKDEEISSATIVNTSNSSLKNRTSQSDTSEQQDEDFTKQIALQKSTEMQLLSGSISFIPEMHLQNYNESTNTIDNAKEEPYVLTTGKVKPGVWRKTYKSLRQSKLVQLCR